MKIDNKVMLFVLLLTVLTFLIVGCENKETATIQDIDYEIISKDELSFGGATRLSVDVVVNEEVNFKELELISEKVLSEVKKDISLNALAINFYDYKEYIGRGGYTLGKTIYAPNGKWEDANTISAGNYRYMEYDFDFRAKDWSNRLTIEEVDIFDNWYDLVRDGISEDDATKQISKKFSISEDKVIDIITKQMVWANEDNK